MLRTIKLMAIALIFSGFASCDKDDPVNVGPTVSISSPADNAIFNTPESIYSHLRSK